MQLFFQLNPVHRQPTKYRSYSPTSLTNAYLAVRNDGMSVRKAAKQFSIPRQTLRDRVKGKIDPDCTTTGRTPVFTLDEEAKLTEHIKTMATYGYGYTRQEVTDLATDFAHMLNKKPKESVLTLRWFEGFIKRWPELRVLKPRSLEIQRAKCGNIANVESYFKELESVMRKYDLLDKPHLIFNVDEKGITLDHKPPQIVAGVNHVTSAVTSGKSCTTTILGCGSASGLAVPPFFVFAGKRMINDLMNGATPGAAGTVSESGWSNTEIFKQYLTEHFLKFVPGRNDDYVLLLLDGHKSHIAVDIIHWAQQHNIIIHILPAHTSHILQPLDVGCYGPLQRIYNNECHKTIRQNSSVITRYNICELACKAYQIALSADNLQAAFRKTGIYPFDKSAINKDLLCPSEVFIVPDNDVAEIPENQTDVEPMHIDDNIPENTGVLEPEDTQSVPEHDERTFFSKKIATLKKVKSENEQNQKARNTIGKVVSGRPITESHVAEKVVEHIENQGKKQSNVRDKNKGKAKDSKQKKLKCTTSSKVKTPPSNSKQKSSATSSPKPGPSHIYIDDSLDFSDTDDDEIDEKEKCCVCKQFTPDAIRQGSAIEFTNWAQCDNQQCKHWVHLKYCTEIRVVRRGSSFYCCHCEDKE